MRILKGWDKMMNLFDFQNTPNNIIFECLKDLYLLIMKCLKT
jgi:hypothetical protein